MTALEGLESLGRALLWCLRSLLPGWVLGPIAGQSHGSSRWATRRDARLLGRLGRPEALAGDGIVMGWWRRRPLQSPPEDNVLLLGVQRSGKTSAVVVPTLLGWTGAAVATSTKEELVRLTLGQRQERGPVWVFAPLDRDDGWLRPFGLRAARWNPVAAASDLSAAAEISDLFTAEGKAGPGLHWYLAASSLLAGLISLEHQRGGDMRGVLRELNTRDHNEYTVLSTESMDPGTMEVLRAHALTPEKEAGSVASTARAAISLWLDERVAAATSNGRDELDLDRLLAERGTLYLVAPTEEAERARPLFSALLQSLLRKATSRARAQGGVLSPRLLMALDEAANFTRIPRLASYVSTGPGQGIQLLLCFHDLAQIEGAYGPEEARTIWNNSRARVLLPGQGDLKTLEQFSKEIGEETRVYATHHRGGRYTSSSEVRSGHPLVSVDELRRLDSALLLYGTAPPARLELRRWDQVPSWRSLVERPTLPPASRPVHASAGVAGKGVCP